MKQIRKRLTYANVMSSIAVFMVLGGAAVAATQLPKDSVGSKQLKKESVGTAKIKANAVNSAKVLDASLEAVDFKAGQLPAGAKGETGATGPAGPKGATGATGATGPAGSAVGYAHILSGGTLDAVNSKNITSVTRPVTGEFCVVLPFTPKVVVGSPDGFGPDDGVLVNPTISSPGLGSCAANAYRIRITTAGAPTTLSNHSFYLLFE